MALGLTQPLTENSKKEYFLGLKVAGGYGWQPFHLHVAIVLKTGSLNLLEPSGPAQACNGVALLCVGLYSTGLSACPHVVTFVGLTQQLFQVLFRGCI